MYTVDGHITEAWLGATNLNVLTFAFIALERDAGQPAHGVGYVGIRQARDDFGRQYLDNIVGRPPNVERLNFAALPFAAHGDDFIPRLHLQNHIRVRHLSRRHRHISRRRRETYDTLLSIA